MEAVVDTVEQEEAVDRPTRGYVDRVIVDTAIALFQERGVKKVSLVDIAEKGGLTRSLIYYYFDGKEGVVERVLERFIHRAVLDISNRLEAESAFDASVVLIQALREFFYEDGEPTLPYTIMRESGKTTWALRAMVEELTYTLGYVGAFARPRRRIRADQGQDIAFALTAVLGYLIVQPDVSDDDLAMAFRASLAL